MDQGAVAAVVQIRWQGGEWSKAWGVRDLETKTAAQPSDLVEVAGITNTMTAVTVLKLVDDGLIRLDDPVNEIIPRFTTLLHPPVPITVRQLLGHISGIPEFTDLLYKDSDIRASLGKLLVTPETAFRLAGSRAWEPVSVGTFSYANTGYIALGLLVETLRHKPFPQVLREEVIEPLGLKDTAIQRLDLNEPRLIHGYITLHGDRLDVTDNSGTADSPSVGVTSTVADVNTFYAALFQGKLISARSLEEMKKRPSLAPYALGMWTWPDGCTGGTWFEGRGAFWAYLTTAVASDDGKYVATMTVVPPPLSTEIEDSAGQSKRDLWSGQIESSLNEVVDGLCQRPPS
jgi:D-alanyl-D-alanine carboxypeptidase